MMRISSYKWIHRQTEQAKTAAEQHKRDLGKEVMELSTRLNKIGEAIHKSVRVVMMMMKDASMESLRLFVILECRHKDYAKQNQDYSFATRKAQTRDPAVGRKDKESQEQYWH